ncbi:MAG: DMT family transporter [Oscillospiraceae bacterium]|nr:DMT family transporter [Oscillospiraceae bacterium]
MKHTTNRWLLLLHLLLFVFSFSGVLSKFAAAESFLSLRWLLFYGGMLFLLAVYALAWQQLLRHIELNRAYACKSVSVIWGMLWGAVIFGEHLTLKQMAGGALVIVGLLVISSAGKDTHDTTD